VNSDSIVVVRNKHLGVEAVGRDGEATCLVGDDLDMFLGREAGGMASVRDVLLSGFWYVFVQGCSTGMWGVGRMFWWTSV
jgi:hypothetical protein